MKLKLLPVISLGMVFALIDPAHALSIGTCAVDNYTANGNAGGTLPDLAAAVSEANNAGSAAQGYGWTWSFANNNANASWSLFANTSTGGMTGVNMGLYVGHGDNNGPVLGSNNGYDNDAFGTDVTICGNYTWSQNIQNWAVSSSCKWLFDGTTTSTGPNWTSGSLALNRWYKAFNSSSGNPNGSLHAIIAARSNTFDTGNTSREFLDNCLFWGNSITTGWVNSMYWEMYINPSSPGIEPALLTAYQTSSGANWGNETLTSPWGNPSLYGSMGYSFYYSYNGTPDFT